MGGMPFTYEEDTIREYWNFCGAIEALEVRHFKVDHAYAPCKGLCPGQHFRW